MKKLSLVACALTLCLGGCMTVGYTTAKNSNIVQKLDVTITEIESQKIYNALGVSLVGPLARVDHVGQKITFLTSDGEEVKIIQPVSDRYVLKEGQKAAYIIDRGQVWVQPLDYPLPPEFSNKPVVTAPIVAPVVAQPPASAPIALAATPSQNAQPSSASVSSKLKTLNALYKDGVINKKDFEAKKQELLKTL